MDYKVGDRVHVKDGLPEGGSTIDREKFGYWDLPMNGEVDEVCDSSVVYRIILDNGKIVNFNMDEQHFIEPIKERTLEGMVGVMEKVLVRDNKSEPWRERYLVATLPHGKILKHLTVCVDSEKEYVKGNTYEYSRWRYAKVKPVEEKKDTIELTVKVNGKEVPLSTISEETLLKIRKNEDKA